MSLLGAVLGHFESIVQTATTGLAKCIDGAESDKNSAETLDSGTCLPQKDDWQLSLWPPVPTVAASTTEEESQANVPEPSVMSSTDDDDDTKSHATGHGSVAMLLEDIDSEADRHELFLYYQGLLLNAKERAVAVPPVAAVASGHSGSSNSSSRTASTASASTSASSNNTGSRTTSSSTPAAVKKPKVSEKIRRAECRQALKSIVAEALQELEQANAATKVSKRGRAWK